MTKKKKYKVYKRKEKKPKPSDISSVTLPVHFTTEWCGPSYGIPDACPFDLQDVA